MGIIDWVLYGTGVVTISLIFLVLYRNRKNPINLAFAFFLLSAAIWPFAISSFRTSTLVDAAHFWGVMIYVAANLVPGAWVYFSYIFTSKKNPPIYVILLTIFIPLVFGGILLLSDLWIVETVLNDFGNSIILGPAYVAWMIYYGVYMAWGTIIFLKKYRHSEGLQKSQILMVLIGSLFPIVGAVYPNIILPYLGNFQYIYFGPVSLAAMNTLITYTIVRHKLLDIRLIIARSFAFLLLLVVLFGIYAGVVFVSTFFVAGISVTREQTILFSIIGFVVVVSFQPLRRLLEQVTQNIFYQDRYETDELLHSFSQTMASTIDLDRLTWSIISLLQDNLHVNKVAFFILEEQGVVEGVYRDRGESYSYPNRDDIRKLSKDQETLVFDELPEGELKEIMRMYQLAVFIPLRAKERTIAYLMLGEKQSGDAFFGQDLRLLEIAGPEFAVAIQNAKSFLEIQEFTQTLERKVQGRTKELQDAQKREISKAKEVIRLKDEFVFIATHDLRTPVTAIDGFVELIKKAKESISEDTRENLQAIDEASDRLNQLVDDLLQVARGESGTIEIKVDDIDYVEVVEKTVRQVASLAKQKKVSINTFLEKEKRILSADSERLSEVLENLLSNAIKFNREGGKVDVSAQAMGDMLQISVSDTGYGIPKEKQEKVFSKFFKHRGTNTQGIAGTGLGLFVVRMLVEKMGGKTSFVSQEGKGTTFIFTLPFSKNQTVKPPSETTNT